MEEFAGLCWMFVTSLLWGVTDPLMKLYGAKPDWDKNKITHNSKWRDSLLFNTISLFTSWRYTAAFLANQLGR